ncbi:MAG: hypothetical protein KDA93_14960 [Planctomycetaceae bacterium]|nr:hypothetical protein [Planctomycetaceae bacterium]
MKSFTVTIVGLFATLSLAGSLFAADYTLEATDTKPKDLPEAVANLLASEGHHIVSPKGPLCDLWLAKSLASKDAFKPDLRVKYPMQVGALIGVLEVKKGPEFTDFRDQVILPGLYTLRYGQQPQDGNHVGTSELRDFLLALPIEDDESTDTLDNEQDLQEISAIAAGSSHPAIFALLPPEQQEEKSSLTHEEDHDFWILQTSAGEENPVVLRLIIVGIGEE